MIIHRNGKPVQATPEEEAAILAAREADAARPEPVPDEATVLQLFDELDEKHGIDLEAQASLVSPKAGKRLRLANVVRRGDPLVRVLQSRLSWTDDQVDDLFRAAAKR